MSDPDDLVLFRMDPVPPAPPVSSVRLRTIRQMTALQQGYHPLGLANNAYLRLHEDAPPSGDRKAPGPRCGGCRFLMGNERGFFKCTWGRTGVIFTPSFRAGPYETHGPATDVRAWWPACWRFEPAQPEETAP